MKIYLNVLPGGLIRYIKQSSTVITKHKKLNYYTVSIEDLPEYQMIGDGVKAVVAYDKICTSKQKT
jgi:hypothetical protein